MSSETVPNRNDEQKAALVERILRGEITLEQARQAEGLSDDEIKAWVGVYRRTSRRVIEDELNAALSARGLPTEDAPISEFSGGLESLALAELIQTVHYGRKDAVIRVDHAGQQSYIWCEQGEVVDARIGRLAGAGAVYRLLSLRDGRVYAHFSRELRARTIEASTPALLLESAKRYDECRQLLERIGDTSAIYVASSTAWAAEASVEPDLNWQMMRAFDGSSSIERVLENSTLPDLETLTCLVQLIERRLLTPKPLPTAPQWLPLRSESALEQEENSVLPLAASLRARLSLPGLPHRKLWYGAAAAGAGVMAVAFAIGFWSARRDATRVRAVASAGDWTQASDGGCPPGMARVQGGPLFAGDPSPAAAALGAVREPMITSFCLSQLEVTVAEFDACVAAEACAPPQREFDLRQVKNAVPAGQLEGVTLQCNAGQAGRERYPINCVNFAQAQSFCAWRGGRLPSQIEWEYAADEANPIAEEAHKGTLPVGSFPAGGTPEGILDLFGNVSEWTTGRTGLRSAAADGSDPARQELYTVMGGRLQGSAQRLASRASRASRLYMNGDARGRGVGFRCALDLEQGASAQAVTPQPALPPAASDQN